MVKRRSVTGLKKRRKPSTKPAVPASSESNSTPTSPAAIVRARPDTTTTLASPALSKLSSKKRRRQGVRDSEDDDEPPSKHFAVLKPQQRYVHQDVVKNTWEVLPEHIQRRVRELFVAVARPVITRYRGEKRRIDAQTALNSITRTLAKRLPRMPFPPTTKEVSFDYEALLNSNRNLEHQLIPALHSAALLTGQIVKEERALAAETVMLEKLRNDARSEVAFRKRHMRKPHGASRLIPGPKEEAEDSPEGIGLAPNPLDRLPSTDDNLDSALQAVVMQCRSHLESMESNHRQVVGITDALCATAAVLDGALFTCLDRSSYGSFLHR